MTRSRLADVTRGVVALIALLALIAGPPAALVSAVGWPLPTVIPSLSAVEDAARSGVSDQFVIKVLATIAWIAWLQIAVAVACELIALARRRPTRHLPLLPGLQPAIAKLAAAALLVAASASSRMPQATAQAAAPSPPPTPVVASAPVAAVAPAPAPLPTTAATTTVTVERHDSYWAIAERTLHDGFRWREIRDANVGRTMPDGHVIAHGSDLVRPGWVLEIPAAAEVARSQAAEAPLLVPTGSEIVVEAGEGFWDIAEDQVEAQLGRAPSDDEIRPFWSALVDTNRGRLADPADPNLLFTGQHLALVGPPPPPVVEAEPAPAPIPPTTPSPAAPEATSPTTTVPAPTTQTPTTPAMPLESPVASPDRPPVEDGDSDSPVTEIAAAGFSALLAVGAARRLAQRRRRRAHLRLVADRPTGPEEAEIHRQILLSADTAAIESLEVGLASLAAAMRDARTDAAPLVVQHGGGHLDVYVDPPSLPPPGWTATDCTGAVWTAGARPATQPIGETSCPAPLLVTLGQPDDGGQLYLDLEAAGLVALDGDPAMVRDVARTMVTDLALSPLGATIDIVVIGDLGDHIARLDHVRCLSGWDDIADDLDAWTTQTHDALVANGWPNPFVARAVDPDHDALGPLAVIAVEPGPPELLARVVATGCSVAGIVVTGSEVPGAMRIDCHQDRIAVPSIGLEAIPHPVHAASLDEIVALLDEPLDETDTSEPTLFDSTDTNTTDDHEPVEPEIVVRVLGDIGVDGDFSLTAKQTAVLAFIALHGTVTAERVENAVWAAPSSSSRRKRLSNTVSEIRAAIGREHLPAAADGRYSPGSAVTTDAHLFDHLVRRAAGEPPAVACDTLRAALDVVSGPVFTYRDVDRASFTWVDLENLVSTWELRIAAVAERCAELHMNHGQPAHAVEVATRALTIIPTHTGITEVLMRAHAANGDRLAVQRVFQAHASALEHLDLDDVADSTAELYDRLSQRSG